MLILSLSDSATIVDICTNVVQRLEWNLLISLYKDLELSTTDEQVFARERIWLVPANRTEFSSILNDGMEEAQSE